MLKIRVIPCSCIVTPYSTSASAPPGSRRAGTPDTFICSGGMDQPGIKVLAHGQNAWNAVGRRPLRRHLRFKSFSTLLRLMLKIRVIPCSCIVTPYSTSASSMVPRRWVMMMNWLLSLICRR
jgi:hypothetical protein